METVFQKESFQKPSLLDRLLGRQPPVNALIAMVNLFSDERPLTVTRDKIHDIVRKHRLGKDVYRTYAAYIYRRFLEHALKDRRLGDAETQVLRHLKNILNLNDYDADRIQKDTTKEVFRVELLRAIDDGKLTWKEKALLARLRKDLRLPEEFAQEVYSENAQQLLDRFVNDAVLDRRVSDKEEQELRAVMKSLRIEFSPDETTKAHLEKYRLLWRIENGNIPHIRADADLHKNEKCYFKTQARWIEGPGIGINATQSSLAAKITSGVGWRTKLMPMQLTRSASRSSDEGRLHLTNRRLVFLGRVLRKSLNLARIVDFGAYENGILVQERSGRSAFLEFHENVDLFSLLLGRALADIV